MGEYSSESNCLTFIRTNKWDSSGDGNGNPRSGMQFYDTSANQLKFYSSSSWIALGSGSPAGSDTYVQYNDNGIFGADSGFFWDKTSKILALAGSDTYSGFRIFSASTSDYYSFLAFIRQRGSIASPTAVQSGDRLGQIKFVGRCVTLNRDGAEILGFADDTYTDTSSPGYLTFRTTPSGSVAPVDRMKITSAGEIITYLGIVPDANDGAYLGTTALGWSDLFLASDGVINWANGNVALMHASNELKVTAGAGTSGGTDAPIWRLQTPNYGAAVLYGRLTFNSTAGSSAYIDYGAEIRGIAYSGVNQSELTFYTSDGGGVSSEKARLTYNGNLLIGTTDNDGTPATGRLVIQGLNADGTANIFVGRDSTNANVASLDSNGIWTATGLALGAGNITTTGSLGVTGARLTKGWFTDLEVTNAITGSITGNAATVTIVNEATDTTCFPLFVTDATGSREPKTVASYTFNSNTGALASTLFSANTITANTAFVPDVNDGAALGTTALQFSDLFLAEGSIINWDNGDVTLTQTGDSLALAGGNLFIGTTAGLSISGVTSNYTLQVSGIDSSPNFIGIVQESAAIQSRFNGHRCNGSFASKTAVASGDMLIAVNGLGWDGGTTPTYVNAASMQFLVDGTVSEDIVPGRIIFNTRNTAGTIAERMRLTSAGGLAIGVTALDTNYLLQLPNSSSQKAKAYSWDTYACSELWKTNIVPIPNSLDKISSLRGITFNYNYPEVSHPMNGLEGIGITAEELESLGLPNLVTKDNGTYTSINLPGIIPILVEAIKELKARLEALE
jgi:hypothetical protein